MSRKLSVIDTDILRNLKRVPLNHDYLSRVLGVSRARINKHVDQLIDDGLVEYYSGCLHIVEPEPELTEERVGEMLATLVAEGRIEARMLPGETECRYYPAGYPHAEVKA
jgi:predicted transcriptional regulator